MTTASIGPNLLLIGIFVLALAAAKGLCAIAMTVPMTAAAASDRATDTGWFFGFGAGIASLFLTRTLAVVLHFALVLGLTAAVVETVNGKMGAPDWTSLGPIFLALYLVAAWASSWFLGTAVLAWECAVKRNAATEDTRGSRRPDAAWFRALRESRQRRA